ncbi:MAG TPA: sulfatase [Terriglobia bacterium]|nr:sulfatase [Terriglobia bacterium]
MKHRRIKGSGTVGGSAGLVYRWVVISAFMGLLIGIFEAWMLWTRPRVIPLLTPDVGYVVWFLAPLIDMAFFALAGLALGWLASRTRGKELFAAVEAALAVTFVTLMVVWFHIEIGPRPLSFTGDVLVPSLIFTPAFLVSLLMFAAVWPWLEALGERRLAPLIRPMGWGLGSAAVVGLAGITVFVLWPPISGPAAPPTVPPPRGAPNIVFITLDTVRADHLSAYGYPRPTTPNLDRFARTGVLFENAIAPISWTLASHASMFTGLLPQQHGADLAVPLAPSPWTLAEILRSRGYETAAFIANFCYLDKGWGIAQGFSSYDDLSTDIEHNLAQTFLGSTAVQMAYQTLWSYNWFDRRSAKSVNAGVFRWYRHRTRRPFFAFINYLDAHDPYITTSAYNSRFGTVSMNLMRRVHSAEQRKLPKGEFNPRERSQLIDGYDNCLAYLDDQVGELLGFFRRSPDWQNTIVIITSDHGEGFGEHGDYMHGFDLYRALVHVPLIIAGPGIPQGLRIGHVVGTRQLFSTVLDLAGHGHTPFSRTSLARFWNPTFKPTPFDDAVVSELVPVGDMTGQHAMSSLTTQQWEYIEHRDGKQELYNWATDPKEQDNLAASPQDQATLESLHTRLIDLVSNATGPWRGMEYLQALDGVQGPSRLSLLFPQPLQPGNAENKFRIGFAQSYFKPQESAPVRPTRSERDVIQSLPYQ